MTQICEFLLLITAALVLLFLCMGWDHQPLVIAYWAVLTARNGKIVLDHHRKKRKQKETV